MVIEIPVSSDPDSEPTVIQNRLNRCLGLVVPIVLLGLLVVSDPFRLWLEVAPDEQVVDASSVVFVTILAGVAVGTVTFGWYPRVVVTADLVEIRNPVYTYRCHPTAIESVETGFRRYPLIIAGGRRIPVVGAEHSLRMSMLQQHSLSQRLEALPERNDTAKCVGDVIVSRRRMTAWEGAVWTVWGIALLIVMARAVWST